ncbi:MAG: DsbA family protein [Pseudomonadota bacterium]
MARVDQSTLERTVTSFFSRVLLNQGRIAISRNVTEWRRRLGGRAHEVHYFHEVDDPYSYLAAQTLGPLAKRYDIELVPHLADPAVGPDIPEPELLARLARRDVATVAPFYGLDCPKDGGPADAASVQQAKGLLAAAVREPGAPRFAALATAVGAALLTADKNAMEALARSHPVADPSDADAEAEAGRALRDSLGHYSGATFHYGAEWYWGVDRLHHLERRLQALGADPARGEILYPRPPIQSGPVARAAEMTLEVFPSLRSPYTAIGFEPTLRLAAATGIGLETRPVLPMVMRGVPATLRKGVYIMTDTHREAEALGMPFGPMFDPIGDPVRRGYSLWPFARSKGRGDAFLAGFLRMAFSEARNMGTDASLQRLVDEVGLDWSEARAHLDQPGWQDEIETNRLAMIDEMGQWGVPSFRLRGPADEPDLAVWGQDRLFVVAAEIQRRGQASP